MTNIVLPVTVIDNEERFVPNLKRSDFVVLEDDRPQQIIDFQVSRQVPLDIAVLVDTSQSVREKFPFERAAAIEFLQALLEQPSDQILVGSFNSEISLQPDFTRRRAQLFDAINRMKIAGSTRLYDAVYQVAQEKAGREPGRRTAIVLISDGADTASTRTFEQTLALAQQKQIVIYGISTQFLDVDADVEDPANRHYLNKGERELRELCAQTGGKLFFPKDLLKIQRQFAQIREELRNQYVIVYEPSAPGGGGRFRAIEVRLVGKLSERPWQVRTRRGYIAGMETRAGLTVK